MQSYASSRKFSWTISALVFLLSANFVSAATEATPVQDKYIQVGNLTQLDLDMLTKAHSDMDKMLKQLKTDKYAFPFGIDDVLKVTAFATAFVLFYKYVTTGIENSNVLWEHETTTLVDGKPVVAGLLDKGMWKAPVMSLVNVGGAVFAFDRFKDHFKRANRFVDAWVGLARDKVVGAAKDAVNAVAPAA